MRARRTPPVILALSTILAGLLPACGGGPPAAVDSALVAPAAVNEDTGQPLETTTAPMAGEPEGLPHPVDPELLRDVGRHPRVVGWTLVPLLEARRGDRALVLVWPAFDPEGELTHTDRVLGFVLERVEGGGHRVTGEPFDAVALTAERAANHLHGTGLELRDRGAGVELDVLGEQLASLPRLFAEAVEAGDPEAAVAHAVSLSRLYSPWAIQDNVGEAMLLTTRGGLRVEHRGTERPEDPAPGVEATVQLSLELPGESPAPVTLQAHRLPDATGWVVGPAPTPPRAARPSP